MSHGSSHNLPTPPSRSHPHYTEYLSSQKIQSDHDHIYLTGTLIIIPNSPHSYVQVDHLNNTDIVITNLHDRNRAVNQDQVVVEILPSQNWLPFNQKKLEQNHDDDLTASSSSSAAEVTSDSILQQLWEPKQDLLQKYSSTSSLPAPASSSSAVQEGSSDIIKQAQDISRNILEESERTQLQPRGRIVAILPTKKTSGKVLYGKVSNETLDDIKQTDTAPQTRNHDHDQKKKEKGHHQQDPADSVSSPLLLFHPNDSRYLPMLLPSSHSLPSLDPNVTYKATIGEWPVDSRYPNCRDIQKDESKGTIEAELAELLQNYTVHTGHRLSASFFF
jgi:exoribonuclease R